jgi:hypothetical protein
LHVRDGPDLSFTVTGFTVYLLMAPRRIRAITFTRTSWVSLRKRSCQSKPVIAAAEVGGEPGAEGGAEHKPEFSCQRHFALTAGGFGVLFQFVTSSYQIGERQFTAIRSTVRLGATYCASSLNIAARSPISCFSSVAIAAIPAIGSQPIAASFS